MQRGCCSRSGLSVCPCPNSLVVSLFVLYTTIVQPLNQLLCQCVQWEWLTECQKAFETLKKKLASSEVLVHYNSELPLKLDCDPSDYRVGALLSHIFPDGEERPIVYASPTPTKGYAHIEKEALSLVYSCLHFEAS